MSIVRGQILLFKGARTWTEKMIVWATHGPYHHVAVALSPVQIIEATSHGISIDTAPTNPDVYDAIDLLTYTTSANIERGLAWAVEQQGKGYGWSDIVFQAIKFLAPNNPLHWGISGHYDCSDFACRYLWEAGVPLPESYLDCYSVTPNDLGRWANLIPRRIGVSYA